MKTEGGTDAAKQAAGEAAAALVADGMTVGLGSGSTAAFAIRALGRRVDEGLGIRGVPTSFESRELARKAGIPLVELTEVTGAADGSRPESPTGIDIAIDGADQVAAGDLIKGGGAAHVREKLVDAVADRFVVVVDPTKVSDSLDRPVPVEVLPQARNAVADAVRDVDGAATLRQAERKDGPVVTDNGNLVLDCDFGYIDDPRHLSAQLSTIPGVVDHGLFVDLADEIYVGADDGTVDVRSP